MDQLDLLDPQDLKDQLGKEVLQDHLVLQDRQGNQAQPDQLDLLVKQEHLVQLGTKVLKETKALLARLVT